MNSFLTSYPTCSHIELSYSYKTHQEELDHTLQLLNGITPILFAKKQTKYFHTKKCFYLYRNDQFTFRSYRDGIQVVQNPFGRQLVMGLFLLTDSRYMFVSSIFSVRPHNNRSKKTIDSKLINVTDFSMSFSDNLADLVHDLTEKDRKKLGIQLILRKYILQHLLLVCIPDLNSIIIDYMEDYVPEKKSHSFKNFGEFYPVLHDYEQN